MLDLMQMVQPLVESTVKPLTLNWRILEAGYELYLKAAQNDYPLINLRELSQRSGSSMLECRNTIVEANKLGKFPNCLLESGASRWGKNGSFLINLDAGRSKLGRHN